MKNKFTLFILFFFLSACGFHLRGRVDMPKWLDTIFISSPSQTGNQELISLLKLQLEGNNIKVIEKASQAKYWLIIKNVTMQQQIVSIGASTNPRQYQLNLFIKFTLQTREGKLLTLPKIISVKRQLTINNDRILGSSEEETILINEMKRDAVIQIINRLSRQ